MQNKSQTRKTELDTSARGKIGKFLEGGMRTDLRRNEEVRII
jgi:hypothetical protein